MKNKGVSVPRIAVTVRFSFALSAMNEDACGLVAYDYVFVLVNDFKFRSYRHKLACLYFVGE